MAQESCAIILPQFIAVCVIALRAKMAAGSKCKYLLYVASADALTNRRRRAEHIVRVSEEGESDHVAY